MADKEITIKKIKDRYIYPFSVEVDSSESDSNSNSENSFDLSDRMAKGVDDNGNVVEGAIIEGCLVNNPSLYAKVNKASGLWSHAEGNSTTASGQNSHAEGDNTTASEDDSHAEGFYTTASGQNSHAEGDSTTASGVDSHAEGTQSVASSWSAHAEGSQTEASGYYAHAEGNHSKASGDESHAEGDHSVASGQGSHAEGDSTTASGTNSHAEGNNTIAAGNNQHVEGKYNIEDEDGIYAHIVGNGVKWGRSNAFALKWDGTFVLANGTEITPNEFKAMKEASEDSNEGSQNNPFVWLSLQKDPNEIQPNILMYGNNSVTYENIVGWTQQGKMPILKTTNFERTDINFLSSYGAFTDIDNEELLTYEVVFQGNKVFSSLNINEPLEDTNSK